MSFPKVKIKNPNLSESYLYKLSKEFKNQNYLYLIASHPNVTLNIIKRILIRIGYKRNSLTPKLADKIGLFLINNINDLDIEVYRQILKNCSNISLKQSLLLKLESFYTETKTLSLQETLYKIYKITSYSKITRLDSKYLGSEIVREAIAKKGIFSDDEFIWFLSEEYSDNIVKLTINNHKSLDWSYLADRLLSDSSISKENYKLVIKKAMEQTMIELLR